MSTALVRLRAGSGLLPLSTESQCPAHVFHELTSLCAHVCPIACARVVHVSGLYMGVYVSAVVCTQRCAQHVLACTSLVGRQAGETEKYGKKRGDGVPLLLRLWSAVKAPAWPESAPTFGYSSAANMRAYVYFRLFVFSSSLYG